MLDERLRIIWGLKDALGHVETAMAQTSSAGILSNLDKAIEEHPEFEAEYRDLAKAMDNLRGAYSTIDNTIESLKAKATSEV